MAITHTKVSAIADTGDATLVQSTDWNATHTIAAQTITYAQIQNVSATSRVLGRITAGAGTAEELTAANLKTILALVAGDESFTATQRVLGRNTAGAGAGEEVTASQLFDWVSSTNGALLTRTGGTWAALANVGTAGGDLLFTEQTAPTTPATGKLAVFAAGLATREMLGALGPLGNAFEAQPFIGRKRTCVWLPNAGSTTSTAWGFPAVAVTGTATARIPASTTLATSIGRLGTVSSAAANSACGFRGGQAQLWLGNAAGLGGFFYVARFNISDAAIVATANMFVGLQSSTAAPTDVLPTTLTNLIGIGCNNGDTVMQLYASGAVAQARVSLGANFPVNTVSTDVYELILYAAPNSSTVNYVVNRLNTAFTASGSLTGASIPTSTTFMCPNWYRSNGGTASAVGIDLVNAYAENDY